MPRYTSRRPVPRAYDWRKRLGYALANVSDADRRECLKYTARLSGFPVAPVALRMSWLEWAKPALAELLKPEGPMTKYRERNPPPDMAG